MPAYSFDLLTRAITDFSYLFTTSELGKSFGIVFDFGEISLEIFF